MCCLDLANVEGGWQRGSRGTVWGYMVISAEAAYTVGETSDEDEGWALLGPEGDWDGEVGFGGALSGH
jgi:hypothetical protein